MSDRFGPRGTIAIIIPLQNANMQPEYEAMCPAGVNNQIYRFDISAHNNAADAILQAVPGCLGCWPDMIISGVSLEMHAWSRQRQDEFRSAFSEAAGGVPATLASDATEAALRAVDAKRIGVLAPMSEVQSQSAQAYYQALGFDVPHTVSLGVKNSADIIKVPIDDVRAGLDQINGDDVDTLLHVGGALGIVSIIEELESQLGKTLVSVNAATYWHALRTMGIGDPIAGFGRLLSQH